MKLRFPKCDPRSNGNSFNSKRPWLQHGATCMSVTKPLIIADPNSPFRGSPYIPRNLMAVKFKGSKDYDLVSPEFLKHK